jgi:hypothetical protein
VLSEHECGGGVSGGSESELESRSTPSWTGAGGAGVTPLTLLRLRLCQQLRLVSHGWMACLSEGLHSRASMGCARVLEALLSERNTHQRELPIAPVEPPDLALSRIDETGLGSISAATCPPTSCFLIAPLKMRVHPGRVATFVLALRAGSVCGADTAVLATLTSTAVVDVVLESPGVNETGQLSGRKRARESTKAATASASLAQLLAVTYEPSVTHGGVLLNVSVPASVTEGSRVVISRVSVVGCDVALGEAPLEVIVGFNHAPAPAGPVYAAAVVGDAPALMRLLDGGASTEEKDAVSGRIRS